jgi:putative ABC transport system permease protein
VQAVGATNALPLSDAGLFALTFKAEGSTQPANFEDTFASFLVVTPDYFKSMGIQVAQGRPFNAQDAEGATPVVIVNEELARRYWPNESPIGKRLSSPLDKSTREIVGVVKTVKSQGLAADTSQEMFLPYRQVALTPSMLTLRAGANTAGLVSAVRSEVKALDPDLPLYDIKMMEERLADSVAKQRFTLVLFGVFAATALLLAAVGMFGVMNYAVTQRTHEIGVRMALGARRLDTLKLILRQGLILTLVGVAIGLAGALALTRLMSGMLYGLSATDPLTFAGVSALLTAVALLACLIPARRATKVDPMVALRYE